MPNSRDFDHTDKVMQFEVTADAFDAANNEVPAELNPQNEIMLLDETKVPGIKTVKLDLHRSNSTWKVNNTTWDDIVKSNYQTVVANPQPDEVQIWEITNKSGGWFHPTHIHLVDFKILSRNGKAPYNYELGPKDVAYVGENESVRLITKFAHQTGRYMIHCHNLPHEDHDMMTQFRVGADTAGQRPHDLGPGRSDRRPARHPVGNTTTTTPATQRVPPRRARPRRPGRPPHDDPAQGLTRLVIDSGEVVGGDPPLRVYRAPCGGDPRLRVHRVVATTVWTRQRRSSAIRQPSPPVAGDHAARLPVRSAPIPATTTNATPTSAAGPGTWCSATRPTSSAIAGSRLISVPNAALVSRRRASSSRLNGTTGSRTASPRPISHHAPRSGARASTGRPTTRRDERGHRHRDREPAQTRHLVADPLGQQDVGRPAARPRPARTRPRRGRRRRARAR